MMRALVLIPLVAGSIMLSPLRALATLPVLADPAASESGQTRDVQVGRDANDRMTVAVRVGETGPYRFLVDTGAERTVISRQLASLLRLAPGAPARMQSVAGASNVTTADIPTLDVSTRRVSISGAPVLDEVHIGADGVLGVDSLASTRVMFDFKHGVMGISSSLRDDGPDDPTTIVVEARRRHGRLMFTRALVDGITTSVVIDTGSEVTLGNAALRKRLLGRRPLGTMTQLETVAGERIMVELATVNALDLDGVILKGMLIAFADASVFRRLELDQRPAMLLGMNALRGFDKVSIDFATRRVKFGLPDSSASDGPRLASD
ncbi:MAG: aspartyl protease family protein [Sphingomicrobium sp.]